ncbi:tellurite resistance TerB family protein [Actinomadura hibisca]|uniref:tellurite resistance TerB family protein n=1 Tax=Actinomadura hibisca TaxID=68565 RepID=UPI00083699B9|nr:tellurite resistance TerB C-terminal domain-containing protein [Actinomadura hibisca]
MFDQALPLRRLASLADECSEALDAFSRLVGRSPEQRGGLAAAALLPEELLDFGSGELGRFVEWARSRLGGFAMSLVPAADFLGWIEEGEPVRKAVIALARLLGQAGIGVEPDPRFGGPVPGDGSVVFFHIEEPPDAAPSRAYQAAMSLLQLGAAVSVSDGHVAAEERQLLIGHLEQALHLTPGERARLRAQLRWLLTTEVRLTGLAKSVAGIDEAQREYLAGFLAGVAAADGRIEPAEVRTLHRIAKLLGLAPETMDERLRAASATASPVSEPVVVRPAAPDPGHAIPRPDPEPAVPVPAATGVRLDQAVLADRIAEAAEVAALLGSVFGDEPPAPPAPLPAVEPVAGLDAAHSRLVRALAEHSRLPRSAWEEMATAGRVLPEGAIDRINEAAYDVAGEPVIEGEDPLEINHDALGAML